MVRYNPDGYIPSSGRKIKEDGSVVNIADIIEKLANNGIQLTGSIVHEPLDTNFTLAAGSSQLYNLDLTGFSAYRLVLRRYDNLEASCVIESFNPKLSSGQNFSEAYRSYILEIVDGVLVNGHGGRGFAYTDVLEVINVGNIGFAVHNQSDVDFSYTLEIVKYSNVMVQRRPKEFIGYSTDPKPRRVYKKDTYIELDTGKMYVFTADGASGEWVEFN